MSSRSLLILSFVALAAAQPGAQNKTIAPTENLVVDGVPAIPASLADDVRRYTESRPASFASWHPTRREMLISTRFGNTAQVHQVKLPGGARTQLTFFNEPIGGATFEPVQGKYLVFGKDVGGNEFDQLYRYDVADGRITLLTDGGRSQNGERRLEHEGRSAGLWLDAPQRDRSRRLRDEPGGSENGYPRDAGRRRRLAGARLVARRHPPPRDRVHLDHQEHALAGRCGQRAEDGADEPGRGGLVRRRRVLGRRPRRVCDRRQGQRVPAAWLHRPCNEAADAARDRSEVGRRKGSISRRMARRWPSR